MQLNGKHNIVSILGFLIILTGLIPTHAEAGENLLLFYSNDVRSEIEACG